MVTQRIGLLRLLWEVKVLPLALIVLTLGMLTTGMAWAHWNEQYIDVKKVNRYSINE